MTVPVVPTVAVMQKDDQMEGDCPEEQQQEGRVCRPRVVAIGLLFVCIIGLVVVVFMVLRQQPGQGGDQSAGVLGYGASESDDEATPLGVVGALVMIGIILFLCWLFSSHNDEDCCGDCECSGGC